ncbi:putative sensor domain DACNV-containing protein [Desertivirga xinjiangensis]|uniref:putative sensor domain DACNV-containing protein n=1 Tax=Desertivirga xinjiangensis TaxID=539206 RepID=UPI00272E9803|nr:hypothetical protein [Pedobacter xinjiangensis]
MPESAYQAARTVSAAVATHFLNHLEGLKESVGLDPAPQPDVKTIEAIIDAGFWASLLKEEGHSPKISLAFLPPEKAGSPLIFERRLPLRSRVLKKIAPGVERAGIHIGVWQENDELYLWGTTRSVPPLCFILEVFEPGLLVVKHRRKGGFGKFVNVAILEGDQVKIVLEETADIPDCPDLLTSLLGLTSSTPWTDSVNVLVQLAASMRAHGRGGTLLIVPPDSDKWRGSIVHPISYPVEPPFSGLSELVQKSEQESDKTLWQNALNREIEHMAGLTAVDGATIMTNKHELLAFGAKIQRAKGSQQIEQVITTEPIIGGEASVIHPSQNGGTRHLSAAQFVHDQRDSIALVASQDGKFTIFAWSPCEGMVHAHRVDSLLL